MAVFKISRGSCSIIDNPRLNGLFLSLSISLYEIKVQRLSFKTLLVLIQIKTERIK